MPCWVGGRSTGSRRCRGASLINIGCPSTARPLEPVATLSRFPVRARSLKIENKGIAANNGALRPFWFNNPAAFNQPASWVLRSDSQRPPGCVPVQGKACVGIHRWRPDIWTGLPSPRLLDVQELQGQRTLLGAVPGGVLQHPQPSQLQRSWIRRQRRRFDRRLDQLQRAPPSAKLDRRAMLRRIRDRSSLL
jgi:hypothetical protein